MCPPRAPFFSVAHWSGAAGLRPRRDMHWWRREGLKAEELRALSDEELEQKLGESRQELFKIRFQAATGALESSARLRHAKREIARILTIKNERMVGHG